MTSEFDPTRLGDVTRPAMGRRQRAMQKEDLIKSWRESECGPSLGCPRDTADLIAHLDEIDAQPDPIPTVFDDLDMMVARGALRPADQMLHTALLARFQADRDAVVSEQDISAAGGAYGRAFEPSVAWCQRECSTWDAAMARFEATFPLPPGFVLRGGRLGHAAE